MLESGAVIAGTAIGSAAGKQISDGVNTRLKKSASILDAASKTGAKEAKAAKAPSTPLLQVGAGVPKAEPNNVPPPPPRRVAVTHKPVKTRPVSVPMVMSAVLPVERAFPVNIDLTGISNGMVRAAVLALGDPSARITMYEDGHLLEIYQYRNQTLASGTVRLRDGAVWAVEARP